MVNNATGIVFVSHTKSFCILVNINAAVIQLNSLLLQTHTKFINLGELVTVHY